MVCFWQHLVHNTMTTRVLQSVLLAGFTFMMSCLQAIAAIQSTPYLSLAAGISFLEGTEIRDRSGTLRGPAHTNELNIG